MSNLDTLLTNVALKDFLDSAGLMDANDGQFYVEPVLTAETLSDYENGCFFWAGKEIDNFGEITVTALGKIQMKKGDVRKTFYYIDFKNEMQNVTFIL